MGRAAGPFAWVEGRFLRMRAPGPAATPAVATQQVPAAACGTTLPKHSLQRTEGTASAGRCGPEPVKAELRTCRDKAVEKRGPGGESLAGPVHHTPGIVAIKIVGCLNVRTVVWTHSFLEIIYGRRTYAILM